MAFLKQNNSNTKNYYRTTFKNTRKEILPKARSLAESHAFLILKEITSKYKNVLSFYPTQDEIDIKRLNALLASSQKLYLPKVKENHLEIFKVTNLDTQVSKTLPFSIFEPLPEKCSLIRDINNIDLAIIPGLSFDKNSNRLGYGKGYYDRLLPSLKSCYTIGIGFKEQFSNSILPVESHDFILDEVILV